MNRVQAVSVRVLSMLSMVLFLWSCANNSTESSLSSGLMLADMSIEGMVCEMGCANTIEEKLNSTAGIISAAVNYEEETCHVEFDATLISDKELVAIVENVNGSDHYTVSNLKVQKKESSASNSDITAELGEEDESIIERIPNLSFPNFFAILRRL